MSSNPAISVREVTKSYDLIGSPGQKLRHLLFNGARSEKFRALKPLSFDIDKGEFFGIIGQNGSGKSTLLQIVSGIIPPTSGSLRVTGRVGAMLELGAGFNPEFTGRDNARLNAQILGIGSREFERLLPEIERFAEIGAFIDEPVKTYSSGMFVRLAFAVQACVDPDILIIDEALAVGDVFFRLKCYERLERLRTAGKTVILVTHSMEDVMHYCDRVLLLHRGEARYCGAPAEAINLYYALGRVDGSPESVAISDGTHSETGLLPEPERDAANALDIRFIDVSQREQIAEEGVRCLRIAVCDLSGKPRQIFRQHETMRILAEFAVSKGLETPAAGVVLRNDKGLVIHGKHTGQSDTPVPSQVAPGTTLRAWHDVTLDVATGEYLVDVALASWPKKIYGARRTVSMAELESTAHRHCVLTSAITISVIPKGDMGFEVQPFYGLAGIASSSNLVVIGPPASSAGDRMPKQSIS